VHKRIIGGLQGLYKDLGKNPEFSELLRKTESGIDTVSVTGLTGSSKFYIAAALSKALSKPVLYLCKTSKLADAASLNLSFFLEQDVAVLRKKEIESGSAVFSSTSQSFNDRLGWLCAARQGRAVIAEAGTLLEKFIPEDLFGKSTIPIKKGDLLLREELISNLVESGYRQLQLAPAGLRTASLTYR